MATIGFNYRANCNKITGDFRNIKASNVYAFRSLILTQQCHNDAHIVYRKTNDAI